MVGEYLISNDFCEFWYMEHFLRETHCNTLPRRSIKLVGMRTVKCQNPFAGNIATLPQKMFNEGCNWKITSHNNILCLSFVPGGLSWEKMKMKEFEWSWVKYLKKKKQIASLAYQMYFYEANTLAQKNKIEDVFNYCN